MFEKILILAAALKWGGDVTLKDETSLAAAVKTYEQTKDKELLVSGKVEKVCQAKGCWMALRDGETSVRVTFKDYGFFVAKDLAGKTVRCQGRLAKETISVADQRHYLMDADLPDLSRGKTPAALRSRRARRRPRPPPSCAADSTGPPHRAHP